MTKKKTTLADIAKAAGLTKAAISLALRNSPQIPEPTRARIKALAADMGYQRNPMVDALMRQVRKGKVHAEHDTIAIICFDDRKNPHPVHTSLREGGEQRAAELGFKAETFWLREIEKSPKELGDILHARGVRAILLLPPGEYGYRLEMGWERFATISFGYQFAHPLCTRILSNHAQAIWLTLEMLRAKGYHRLGYVTDPGADEETTGERVALYNRYMPRLPAEERLPILWHRRGQPLTTDTFRDWIEQNRPEVVIGRKGPLSLLREIGLKVPDEIGFACLAVGGELSHCSGILIPDRALGAEAVEILTESLYLNRIGLPELRKTILVDCEWVDGDTLSRGSEYPTPW